MHIGGTTPRSNMTNISVIASSPPAQLPDLYDYPARHRSSRLLRSVRVLASTNRNIPNIAREDVVQKHHQTTARCRRLLAGEPRHTWFVTKVEFSAAPEAPCSVVLVGDVEARAPEWGLGGTSRSPGCAMVLSTKVLASDRTSRGFLKSRPHLGIWGGGLPPGCGESTEYQLP